jgi:hypothetical protein
MTIASMTTTICVTDVEANARSVLITFDPATVLAPIMPSASTITDVLCDRCAVSCPQTVDAAGRCRRCGCRDEAERQRHRSNGYQFDHFYSISGLDTPALCD